jgi:hypothetical protein
MNPFKFAPVFSSKTKEAKTQLLNKITNPRPLQVQLQNEKTQLSTNSMTTYVQLKQDLYTQKSTTKNTENEKKPRNSKANNNQPFFIEIFPLN